MKKLYFVIIAAVFIVGCKSQTQKSEGGTATSRGGLTYTRLYIPDANKVSLQIAFPSDWATRGGVNPAASYVGAELILAGGAEGYPAGEVVEIFSDLKAEARLSVTPDFVIGQLEVDTKNLMEAAEIANAHLAKPTLATDWLGRVREGFAARVTDSSALPAFQAFGALRWAIFGNTQLRKSLSLDEAGIIQAVTQAMIKDWHTATFQRTGAKIVIAGDITEVEAGQAVDAMMRGLPQGDASPAKSQAANFAPKRILLHLPDAEASTLMFLGPLPPTRNGGEMDDILAVTILGSDDQSILFDAVRTKLRASYGFGASIDGFTRDLRLLVLSGEVETAKIVEAETVVRAAYSDFLKQSSFPDIEKLKSNFANNGLETAKNPSSAAFFGLMALLDGQDAALALNLGLIVSKVDETTLKARLTNAFPKVEALMVIVVSPDANAMPGACVITKPEQAAACP